MLAAERDVRVADADARPVRPLRVGPDGRRRRARPARTPRRRRARRSRWGSAARSRAGSKLPKSWSTTSRMRSPSSPAGVHHDLLGVEALRTERLAEPAAPAPAAGRRRPTSADEDVTPPERARSRPRPQPCRDQVDRRREASVAVDRPRDRLLAQPARQLDAPVVGDRRAVDGDAGVVARGEHRVRRSARGRGRARRRRQRGDDAGVVVDDLDRHAGDGGGGAQRRDVGVRRRGVDRARRRRPTGR